MNAHHNCFHFVQDFRLQSLNTIQTATYCHISFVFRWFNLYRQQPERYDLYLFLTRPKLLQWCHMIYRFVRKFDHVFTERGALRNTRRLLEIILIAELALSTKTPICNLYKLLMLPNLFVADILVISCAWFCRIVVYCTK